MNLKMLFLMGVLLMPMTFFAQTPNVISSEADVPAYTLPDLLVSQKGRKIKNVKTWEKIRRSELLNLFETEMFGKVPGKLEHVDAVVLDEDNEALNGIALRKQIGLTFSNNGKKLYVELLMYLPKGLSSFPTFLGYNFSGNHTICNDPNIDLTESWVYNNPAFGIVNNQITEQSRGVASDNWPLEMIIKSGCGLATMYYGDIDPDRDNYSDGIHPLFYSNGQTRPADDEWGAIAAWAWGLSRALDYMETDKDLDVKKVVVIGHSRLGKTALWAGATDQRYAAVISNDSGCCGAALSRRKFGETIQIVNHNFPHWLCYNFRKYSNHEDRLPFDQHELLALIAPRPLYVASATEDSWSDPRGEFLSALNASPAYKLFGLKGLETEFMPKPDSPVKGIISYHIRTGKHDITSYDWSQYIDFAKTYLP